MPIWGGRAWGQWEAGVGRDTRLGGRQGKRRGVGGSSHPHCVAPSPWRRYDGTIALVCGQSHITWGLRHERAAWGPEGEAGWAGQCPLGPGVAWLSLAAAVGIAEIKEQVGRPSQPSHHGHLYCGGLGLRELFVGGKD